MLKNVRNSQRSITYQIIQLFFELSSRPGLLVTSLFKWAWDHYIKINAWSKFSIRLTVGIGHDKSGGENNTWPLIFECDITVILAQSSTMVKVKTVTRTRKEWENRVHISQPAMRYVYSWDRVHYATCHLTILRLFMRKALRTRRGAT